MITKKFIDDKAKNEQIDTRTILREYFQLVFLKYFYREKPVSFKAYFKGGTAIRFIFNSFRFSEDLDFTCVGDMEAINNLVVRILPAVENEVSGKIIIKDERSFFEVGLGKRLVLENELTKQPLGLRLDFSFRETPLDPKASVISAFNYPVSPMPFVDHYSEREILVEKIRTILARNKARDVFDLWFLFKKGEKIDWKMLKEKMKIYPELKFSIEDITRKINECKESEMAKDMNAFMPKSHRIIYRQVLNELGQYFKNENK